MSITYANGTAQQYTYNPLGEATQFLNANGQAIGYTYNADGLVATETFADGTSYTYTYNVHGNLTSATDAQGNVTTFVYGDSSNPDLLTEVEYPDGTWLKFSYNVVGQRTQSVDQTGFTVNYTYDSLGRLSELTDGSGNLIVQYTYDTAGNLIQKDNGNGTARSTPTTATAMCSASPTMRQCQRSGQLVRRLHLRCARQRPDRHQPGRRVGLHLRRRQPAHWRGLHCAGANCDRIFCQIKAVWILTL